MKSTWTMCTTIAHTSGGTGPYRVSGAQLARGLALLSVLAIGQIAMVRPVLAQTERTPSPLDAATTSKADQPVTVSKSGGPLPTVTSDADILRLLKMLTGSFVAEAKGETPALRYNAASVNVVGLDNAVVFEIARADNTSEPFRLGILHAYRRRGELRLRSFDLGGVPTLKDALAHLWAAPEAFPKVEVNKLTPTIDMPLKPEGEAAFAGETAQPYPTTREGAIEMTSSIRVGKDTLAFGDAGYDADGKLVWGVAGGDRIAFKRMDTGLNVNHLDGGLIVITIATPRAGENGAEPVRLVEGGELTLQYTGWLTTGEVFDTSRVAGRDPFRVKIPGGVIKGWNEGLKGIAAGERRRLIVPPALGWGDRGAGRGVIPPGATVIFDVECLYVDNSGASAPGSSSPAPNTPPGTPPGTAPGSPQPAQTPPPAKVEPIGKPALNSTPERPK